jgi:hypothetical protein
MGAHHVWVAGRVYKTRQSKKYPPPCRSLRHCCVIQRGLDVRVFAQVALHSEGVGSKWSTVAVIETQAMADAVGYSLQTDRVVGIVYFGLAQPEDTPTSLRRKPLTELLVRVP